MIHDTATVERYATIGEGTDVWHYSQIRSGAKIGSNCIIGRDVFIDKDVEIGDHCKVQNGSYLYYPAKLGNGVFVGPRVTALNDPYPRAVTPSGKLKRSEDWDPQGVTLKSGASIGGGAVLLPGICIGEWAMVGSGSVVVKDVPPHTLVCGNPARRLGLVCRCGRPVVDIYGPKLCPTCDVPFGWEAA